MCKRPRKARRGLRRSQAEELEEEYNDIFKPLLYAYTVRGIAHNTAHVVSRLGRGGNTKKFQERNCKDGDSKAKDGRGLTAPRIVLILFPRPL